MENADRENALMAVANGADEFLANGISGGDPVFDVALMSELAREKLRELNALPQFDLASEDGRKQLRKAIKPVKQIFADFEKNIKTVKKYFSEIPKKCDAVSKALRDLAEPAIARAEAPFAELKAQAELTERWWKKEGIPFDKFGLERLLEEVRASEPVEHSTEAERSDFLSRKGEYLSALENALRQLELAEQAEKERMEAQAKEAERLRLVAEEQRREREALEAERARLAAEEQSIARLRQSAEAEALAAKLQANLQAEADLCELDSFEERKAPAASPEERKAMRWEALEALKKLGVREEIAVFVLTAIFDGKIPHVRFDYGQ